ncbi:MAG: hypothetical protein ACTHMY_22080 [Solirubrobacteraceae bacterium]
MRELRDMNIRVAGWMRAVRAYLPGVGTAGSLLAGAVLMFIVASALVAFRGWPHVGAQPSPGEVVVSPAPTAAAGSTSGRRLALFTAVGPAAGVAGPAAAGAGPRPGAGPAGRTGPPRSLGRPVTASRPVASPAAGGTTGSCASGCSLVTAPGSAPTRPTQPVQQVIRQTTGALGGALSGTGNQVGSAVQKTTGAVAGAVQPVSPPAAGAVNSAGAGASKTVTGVTQTIAGALSGLQHH